MGYARKDIEETKKTSLKYGYRDQHAVFVEDLSHSDFGS